MIIGTDMEYSNGAMVVFTKDFGRMVSNTEMVDFSRRMVLKSKDSGRKEF